jgi:outer membrane protein assembly factor BamA
VVFSPELTDRSVTQLQKAMQNKGYFAAVVDTIMKVKDRKVDITYNIQAGKPYIIRRYDVLFQQNELKQIAENQRTSLIHEGMQYNVDVLNQERQRIARAMRRHGCFYFDEEAILFEVDSTRGKRQLDVAIRLQDYIQSSPELQERIFKHYTISRVLFHMDYEMDRVPEGEIMCISAHDGYEFTWVGGQ